MSVEREPGKTVAIMLSESQQVALSTVRESMLALNEYRYREAHKKGTLDTLDFEVKKD